MELGKLGGYIPSGRTCVQLLHLIEWSYEVSLVFWVSINERDEGIYEYWLYTGGGGHVFDNHPDLGSSLPYRILEAQEGSIYPPLWSALIELESQLSKVMKPNPPPVPMEGK